MVTPTNMYVDGKVWLSDNATRNHYRLDIKTGKWENIGLAKAAGGRQISGYGNPTDKDNNVCMLEFGGNSIGMRNAKTGEVKIWATPDQRIAAAARPLRRPGPPVVRRICAATPSACSIRRPSG